MDLLLQHSSVCSAQCEQRLVDGGGGGCRQRGGRVKRQKGIRMECVLLVSMFLMITRKQGLLYSYRSDGKMGKTACAISSPQLMDTHARVSRYTPRQFKAALTFLLSFSMVCKLKVSIFLKRKRAFVETETGFNGGEKTNNRKALLCVRRSGCGLQSDRQNVRLST